MKLQSVVTLLMILSNVCSYSPVCKNYPTKPNFPSLDPSASAFEKVQDNCFPEMEFPSSVLELKQFYFKPKNEILEPFSEEVKSIFKSIANKDKPKPSSEKQSNFSDFIQKNSNNSLKVNETPESDVDKQLEDDQTIDKDNFNFNLDVGFVHNQFSQHDTVIEKNIEEKSGQILEEESMKYNNGITEFKENSSSSFMQNSEIYNTNYNADSTVESAAADDVDFIKDTETIEDRPKSFEESNNLEELLKESATDKIFKETFNLSEQQEDEVCSPNSSSNNNADVHDNNEINSAKTDDNLDYMDLTEATKSKEAKYVTENYEDQIPSPIIFSESSTGKVTSNSEPNGEALLDSEQENVEVPGNILEEEVPTHPVSPAEFILSHSSATTNTYEPSCEIKPHDLCTDDELATSFCENEPVIEKTMFENDTRDL